MLDAIVLPNTVENLAKLLLLCHCDYLGTPWLGNGYGLMDCASQLSEGRNTSWIPEVVIRHLCGQRGDPRMGFHLTIPSFTKSYLRMHILLWSYDKPFLEALAVSSWCMRFDWLNRNSAFLESYISGGHLMENNEIPLLIGNFLYNGGKWQTGKEFIRRSSYSIWTSCSIRRYSIRDNASVTYIWIHCPFSISLLKLESNLW